MGAETDTHPSVQDLLDFESVAVTIRQDMMLATLPIVQNVASTCADIAVQHLLMLRSARQPEALNAGLEEPSVQIPFDFESMAVTIRQDMMLATLPTVQKVASTCTDIAVQHLLMLRSARQPVAFNAGPEPLSEVGMREESAAGTPSSPCGKTAYFEIGGSDADASSPRGWLGWLAEDVDVAEPTAEARQVLTPEALQDPLQEWPVEVPAEPEPESRQPALASGLPGPVPEAPAKPAPLAAPERTADAPAVQAPAVTGLPVLAPATPPLPTAEALSCRPDTLDVELDSLEEPSGTADSTAAMRVRALRRGCDEAIGDTGDSTNPGLRGMGTGPGAAPDAALLAECTTASARDLAGETSGAPVRPDPFPSAVHGTGDETPEAPVQPDPFPSAAHGTRDEAPEAPVRPDPFPSAVHGTGDPAGEASGAPVQAGPVPGAVHGVRDPAGETSRTPAQADPVTGAAHGARQRWVVVGGEETGGILVRSFRPIDSPVLHKRLCTGALIEEIKLEGHRLHFQRLEGTGPEKGWVSVKAKGKDLAVRVRPPPGMAGPKKEGPLPVAILFPTAGLPTERIRPYLNLPVVKALLDKTEAVLGFDLRSQCPHGPVHHKLMMQFVTLLAGHETLKSQRPDIESHSSAMMGIGVGLFAALCAAGVWTIEDGLKLVQTQVATLVAWQGDGCTLMVSNVEEEELQSLCLKVTKEQGTDAVCEITIFLGPKVFGVGGTRTAVSLLAKLAKKAGAYVLETELLPWGTKLMRSQQAKHSRAVDQALPNMKSPRCTVWMPGTAKPARPGCDCREIARELKTWSTVPDLRSQCLARLHEDGISEIYSADLWRSDFLPIKPKTRDDWMHLMMNPLLF